MNNISPSSVLTLHTYEFIMKIVKSSVKNDIDNILEMKSHDKLCYTDYYLLSLFSVIQWRTVLNFWGAI